MSTWTLFPKDPPVDRASETDDYRITYRGRPPLRDVRKRHVTVRGWTAAKELRQQLREQHQRIERVQRVRRWFR